jgi:MerR family transcriptional regulator, light-induced transcriptional regulator
MDAAAEGQGMMDDAEVVAPEPTLTVAAVARRMGVAPPTLRTWDRRYGLGPSAHTAGAHRRYTSADVARLLVMRRLTLEGVSPADAAKIAKATPVQPIQLDQQGVGAATPGAGLPTGQEPFQSYPVATGRAAQVRQWEYAQSPQLRGLPDSVSTDSVSTDSGTSSAESVFDAAADESPDPFSDLDLLDARRAGRAELKAEADALEAPWRNEPGAFDEPDWLGVLREADGARSAAGGGRVVALPYGTPQSRGLARAAMALDTFEMSRLLRDALRRKGVVSTWTLMVMPVLRALGERTLVTGDGIDVEHAFSEVVLSELRGVVADLQRPRNSSPVLLVCADGDYHSMPLHALAAALAERQVACRMLGSGLPPHALSASVRRTGPSVIVLYARMEGADAGSTQMLRRQRPAPAIVLAGPGWQTSTIPTFARLAASLPEAIDEVLLGVHL